MAISIRESACDGAHAFSQIAQRAWRYVPSCVVLKCFISLMIGLGAGSANTDRVRHPVRFQSAPKWNRPCFGRGRAESNVSIQGNQICQEACEPLGDIERLRSRRGSVKRNNFLPRGRLRGSGGWGAATAGERGGECIADDGERSA